MKTLPYLAAVLLACQSGALLAQETPQAKPVDAAAPSEASNVLSSRVAELKNASNKEQREAASSAIAGYLSVQDINGDEAKKWLDGAYSDEKKVFGIAAMENIISRKGSPAKAQFTEALAQRRAQVPNEAPGDFMAYALSLAPESLNGRKSSPKVSNPLEDNKNQSAITAGDAKGKAATIAASLDVQPTNEMMYGNSGGYLTRVGQTDKDGGRLMSFHVVAKVDAEGIVRDKLMIADVSDPNRIICQSFDMGVAGKKTFQLDDLNPDPKKPKVEYALTIETDKKTGEKKVIFARSDDQGSKAETSIETLVNKRAALAKSLNLVQNIDGVDYLAVPQGGAIGGYAYLPKDAPSSSKRFVGLTQLDSNGNTVKLPIEKGPTLYGSGKPLYLDAKYDKGVLVVSGVKEGVGDALPLPKPKVADGGKDAKDGKKDDVKASGAEGQVANIPEKECSFGPDAWGKAFSRMKDSKNGWIYYAYNGSDKPNPSNPSSLLCFNKQYGISFQGSIAEIEDAERVMLVQTIVTPFIDPELLTPSTIKGSTLEHMKYAKGADGKDTLDAENKKIKVKANSPISKREIHWLSLDQLSKSLNMEGVSDGQSIPVAQFAGFSLEVDAGDPKHVKSLEVRTDKRGTAAEARKLVSAALQYCEANSDQKSVYTGDPYKDQILNFIEKTHVQKAKDSSDAAAVYTYQLAIYGASETTGSIWTVVTGPGNSTLVDGHKDDKKLTFNRGSGAAN